MEKQNTVKKKLQEALLKKAMGYTESDITEEYNIADNEVKLSKKKINKKTYGPDINAIQLCLQSMQDVDEYSHMSIEQLEQEREKLLKLLLQKSNFKSEGD